MCFVSPLRLAGAYRRRHPQHKPRWDGGRRRRSRSRWRTIRTRGWEWTCGGAWFPKSWSSRFTLHEQSSWAGTVIHGHVIRNEAADWTEHPCLPVVDEEGGERWANGELKKWRWKGGEMRESSGWKKWAKQKVKTKKEKMDRCLSGRQTKECSCSPRMTQMQQNSDEQRAPEHNVWSASGSCETRRWVQQQTGTTFSTALS